MVSWVVPETCTLPTEEQPLRVTEFDELFADALLGVDDTAAGKRRLILDVGAEERARQLTQRETGCCSFFTFTFSGDEQGRLLMDITAPVEHTPVVQAIVERALAARTAS